MFKVEDRVMSLFSGTMT